MLTFLRRIRKSLIDSLPSRQAGGSARKYLVYAIGEILLVMIGILLALQVNNWNEGQHEKKRTTLYLQNIKSDFENHLEAIEETHNFLEVNKECAKYVADYVRGEIQVVDTFKLIKSLNRSAYIVNFKIQNSTWDEIISVGDLKLIKNSQLKSQISYFLGEYEVLTELEERKYNPVLVEFLDVSSLHFDVSNNFESTTTSTSFSSEGIWVDFNGLRRNETMSVLLRKVYRVADEQQDFLISILDGQCRQILQTIEKELENT